MVQLITGLKGSGKTKKLVDMVRAAVNEETGDVVCIEKERQLTFDIPYQARLIDAGVYDIGSYEFLRGLICGVHAGNYDIIHFFIDNFYKLVNDKSPEALVGRLARLCSLRETAEPVTPRELLADFDWKKVRTEDIRIDGWTK